MRRGVGLPSLVLAYDGWNQAAAEETCQTLRAVTSAVRAVTPSSRCA